METVLRLEHVSKRFGSRQVLTDINLALGPGEVHAYLGPNGAGKTTTIKIILNFLVPDRGRVEVFGHDVVRDFEAVRPHLGVVSAEKPYLFMGYTLETNLKIFGELHGLRSQTLRSYIDEVVAFFQLEDKLRIPVGRMSAGERIKASFCRALLHRPSLLILDEPTSSMDVPSAADVRRLLAELSREQGKTLFLATHNMVEAQQLANTISFLDHGRIRVQGQAKQVLESLRDGKTSLRVVCADPQAAYQSLDGSAMLRELVASVAIEDHAVVLTLENNKCLNEPLTRIASVTEIYEVTSSAATLEELFLKHALGQLQEADYGPS